MLCPGVLSALGAATLGALLTDRWAPVLPPSASPPLLCAIGRWRACAREQVCESPCSANVSTSTSLPGTDCKLLSSSTPCKAPEHGALIHDQDSDALFAARVPGQAVPARVWYPGGSRESCWQVQVRASMTLPV